MYPTDAFGGPVQGARSRQTRAGARPYRPPRGLPAAGLVLSTASWYTFFVFGAAAPSILGPLFLAPFGGANGDLFALATAGVAVLARPLGALFFGRLGDLAGRRPALLAALTLAAVAIVLIGALPAEASVGVLAPALLVGLMLVHGLATGGAWSGMTLSLTEAAAPRRRGWIGGFVQSGVACGSILANVAVFATTSAFDPTTFHYWGWRVPFLAGGVLFLAVGLIAARRREPTPEELDAPPVAESPVREVFRRPGRLILGAGLLFSANAAFYVTITGTVEYGVTELKLDRTSLVGGAFVAAVLGVAATLSGGALADRMGRRPVVILSAIASGILAFPFFWLVNTAAVELVCFAMVVSAFAASLGYGAMAAYLAELYDYRHRYTGTAVTYHLGAAIAGGAAQVAVLKLPTYVEGGVSWFLVLSAALTVVCAIALPETRPRTPEQVQFDHAAKKQPLGQR